MPRPSPGASTRITAAPHSPSRRTAAGPARATVRSTTLIPSRADPAGSPRCWNIGMLLRLRRRQQDGITLTIEWREKARSDRDPRRGCPGRVPRRCRRLYRGGGRPARTRGRPAGWSRRQHARTGPGTGRAVSRPGPRGGAGRARGRPGVAAGALRRGLRLAQRSRRVRRGGPVRRARARLPAAGAGARVPAAAPLRHRARHGRAHDRCLRHRRRQGPLPARDAPRRHRRVPAVQRARRGLRPRLDLDRGGPRLRRLAGQRPEGLELGGSPERRGPAGVPHRRTRAAAPQPDRVRAAHALAWGHRAPDPSDDRRGLVQRGVPR